MTEFRFRSSGEGLSASDEQRIRRFLEDDNKRIAEINKKLPPNRRQPPLDVDRMVYSIATGDTKKREKILSDLKEKYPSPPPSELGIPVVTAPVTQAANGPVTVADSNLSPSVTSQKQAAANQVYSNAQLASANDQVNFGKIRDRLEQVAKKIEKLNKPPTPDTPPASTAPTTPATPPAAANAGSQVVTNQVPAAVTPQPATASINNQTEVKIPDKRPPAYEWGEGPSGVTTLAQLDNRITSVDITKPVSPAKPRDNPLRKFANFTYGLSLRAMTIQDFNEITENPSKVRSKTNNVLIVSAGTNNQSLKRSPNFIDDFFFDNFKLTTVIGMNSRGRGSNVIEMSFTIIEPYGITLINRILKEAERLNIKRWDEMPFLMVIDFFGNTDGGLLEKIPEQAKYLPIRIIDIKIKLSAKGSEYQVSAVPYSHQAYSETIGITPINLEVTASTIKDFFNSSGVAGSVGTINSKIEAEEQRRDANLRNLNAGKNFSDTRYSESQRNVIEQSNNAIASLRKTRYKVGSYAAAINEYFASLKTKSAATQIDTYSFEIDPRIADAVITTKEKNSAKTTPMASPIDQEDKINFSKLIFPVNAGTSIIEVINQAIRNSAYITDQINLSKTSSEVEANKPLMLYKILPKIKIGEFDTKRNTHSKTITYVVKSYKHYNTKYPFATNSNPSSWIKEYNYIFTGANESIIDLNIDFNTAFYVAIQSFRGKVTEAVGSVPNAGEANNNDVNNTTATTSENSPSNTPNPANATPNRIVYTSGSSEPTTNTGSKDDSSKDLFKSVLSSARGDMLNIQMTIVGDPEFIKQDDLLYVEGESQSEKFVDEFGSIITDASEVFVYLRFKTPSDLDQSTGLMDFSKWKEESSFNGIYRVMTVTSEFSKGQFTQTIDLIRQTNQEDIVKKKEKDDKRENPTGRSVTETGEQQKVDQSQQVAAAGSQSQPGPDTSRSTTASTPANEVAPPIATGSTGAPVEIGKPRIRPDESPISEVASKRGFKAGFDTLKSKISGAATSVGDFTNNLGRKVFAPDPNAPPYTGSDPIVRARLGLPPLDEK